MQLTKEIIKHIKVNGGGTFTSTLDSANLTSGFMVSYEQYEQVVSLETAHTTEIKGIASIAKSLNAYVGTWLNDGKIYLDISTHVKNLNDAITLGKQNNQLAIYDIKNDTVINL